MTHPSRTHRKYPQPTPRDLRRQKLLFALVVVPAAGLIWFLLGWDFWRRLTALLG